MKAPAKGVKKGSKTMPPKTGVRTSARVAAKATVADAPKAVVSSATGAKGSANAQSVPLSNPFNVLCPIGEEDEEPSETESTATPKRKGKAAAAKPPQKGSKQGFFDLFRKPSDKSPGNGGEAGAFINSVDDEKHSHAVVIVLVVMA